MISNLIDLKKDFIYKLFIRIAIPSSIGTIFQNLIAIVDLNGQQIDGSTSDVLNIGSLKDKFSSFGWEVVEIEKGNNMEQVFNGMVRAKELTKNHKPVVVLMKTIMGNGVDFMMHTHKWHGIAPNDEQLDIALSQNPETLGDY